MRVLELDNPMDLATEINQGLKRNDLVVVRNVKSINGSLLSASEYTNLMNQVGRIWTTNDELKAELRFQLPGYPEIIELTHDGLLGAKSLPLHSDASHHPARPYPARALLPVVLPGDESAETSWISTYDTGEPKFAPLRELLPRLVGWHGPAYGTGWPGRWSPLLEVDPWSGRQYVSYDRIFVKKLAWITPSGPEELDQHDYDYVVGEVRVFQDSRPAYTHVWKSGDLLIWNNRGTLHSRTAVTPGHSRTMWRITFDLVW